MSNSEKLIDLTIHELEQKFKPLSDEEREAVVSRLWEEYHNSCSKE